ncbi:MAG TPA: M20 family peptidase, partial [Rubrivivax sp.]|nr:M20 family peptidase [Rubrivivax sp.]
MAAWRCVVVSLALLAAASARAELSALEQRIVDAVKARAPAALQLLERSVRISSSSLDPEGVQAVGRLLRTELDALGFATRWVD